jgi:hypothetical protein
MWLGNGMVDLLQWQTSPPQLLKMWLLGQAFDPSSCPESTAQIFSPTEQEEMECKTIFEVLISQPLELNLHHLPSLATVL